MPDERASGPIPEPAPDAVSEARVPARAWAARRLDQPPWVEVATRAALLLVGPPRTDWMTPALVQATKPVAWLLVDRADVRGLPAAQREPLAVHGVHIEEAPAGDLVALVVEAAEFLIEGVMRRSLEVRWTLGHAEALHDPLRRLETMGRGLASLPQGGEERVLRPLFLQAADGLASLPNGGLAAVGETAGAVARLACVLESGLHPPLEWLAHEARATNLGGRLASWLEDATRAAAGDANALRRVLAAREGVARMLAEPIRERLGASDWLSGPRAFALRPPR